MVKFQGEADGEYRKVKGYIRRMVGKSKIERIEERWDRFLSDQRTAT
jgi:hypothetical protein